MERMTLEEKDFGQERERDDARQCLHDTLTEVGAKLERAEDSLRPDHLIEGHAVGASLIAGALGFVFGSTSNSRVAGPIVVAALLGFALSKHRSGEEK